MIRRILVGLFAGAIYTLLLAEICVLYLGE